MNNDHLYDSTNRCIHCGGSRSLIEANNWECSLIDTPAVNGKRIEISHDFSDLENYISKIPSVVDVLGVSEMDNTWTLHIDVQIGHDLSDIVVKHLDDIINEMKIKDNLPVIMPDVPIDFSDQYRLRCIISSEDEHFTPNVFLKWIQPLLPNSDSEDKAWHKLKNIDSA